MSRSYKKNPVTGWANAKTEKTWKKSCSRKRRRLEANILSQLPEETPDIHDPTAGSFGPKDGKVRWGSDDDFYVQSFRK